MTNFILSTIAGIIVAVVSLAWDNTEPTTGNQLSEQEQIEIYEQVMDGCMVNND